ncbi:AMP-binding protein [Nocardia sp. NPDC056064]|uniref:AMP-binding protein n=1 Tax=Nocardia sp. NPDC056064 TaxID=3345701 RepID=UPI0035DE9298
MSKSVFRLTAAQEAIWNAIQLSDDPGVWVVCELSIYEASASSVAEAARRVVGQVPILYTRVHHGEGEHAGRIVQTRTHDPSDSVVLVSDVDIGSTSDAIDAARTLLGHNAPSMAITIDVPLFSIAVIPLGADKAACVQMYNHIVIDGFGASLIQDRIERELARGYAPDRVLPYDPYDPDQNVPDELVSEENYRSSENYDRDWEFWRNTLDVEVENPYGGGRKVQLGDLSDSHILDQSVMDSLTLTAKKVGCHRIEVLTGLYVGFVAYRLGIDRVTFAMPFSNRVRFPTLAAVPCMLVNVLPIQIATDEGTDTLYDLATRTATVLREVGKHSRFRGEELVARVDGADGRLLAGIGINIRTFFGSTSSADRVSIATGPREPGGLQIDLGPAGELTLTLPRVIGHEPGEPILALDDFVSFCRNWLASPDLALREVPLYAAAQWEAIGGPRAAARISLDCILRGDLIERMPQAPTVTAHEESGAVRSFLSTDLFAHVRSRRSYLESVIDDCELTAVVAGRGLETLVTILAMLQARRPFTLIDQAHPPARIRQILELATPKYIVRTDSATKLPVPADSVGGEGRDGFVEVFTVGDTDPRPVVPNEHTIDWADTAYVIFTSGSTGVPKGVAVSRSALERFLSTQISTLHNPGFCDTRRGAAPRRAAITASFGFDAFYEQLCFLLVGYDTHVYSEAQRRDPEELAFRLAADQIEIIDLTPSHAQALLTAGLWSDTQPGPTTVLLGGETVPLSLWQQLRRHTDVLANTYGPTENTVDTAIFYEFPAAAAQTPAGRDIGVSAPIGRLLPGVAGLVVNALGIPVRPGDVGELVVYGDQLMTGYLSGGRTIDPTLRQLVNEVGALAAYATGDLVWIDDVHGLVFASRNDRQVQIRGNRVDLAEVEKSLLALACIQHCAARVSMDGRLEAVVVLVADNSSDISEIRRQLGQHVPASHVPARLTAVDSLEYNVNGKVDWDAVWSQVAIHPAQPDALDASLSDDFVVGPGHEVLAETVREVLADHVPGSLLAASFLELGGDSLSTIDVVARMHVRGWRVAAADLRASTRLIDVTVTHLGVDPNARYDRDQGLGISEVDWIADGAELSVELPPIAIAAWEAAGRDLGKLLRFCYSQVYSIQASPGEVRRRLAALCYAHPLLAAKLVSPDESDIDAVPTLTFTVTAEDSRADESALRVLEFPVGTATDSVLEEVWARENSEREVFAAGVVPRPDGGADVVLVVSHLVMDPVSWRIVERAVMAGEGPSTSTGALVREIDWYAHSQALDQAFGRSRHGGAYTRAEHEPHGHFVHTSHRLDFENGLVFVANSGYADLLGGDLLDIVVVAVVRAMESRPSGVEQFLPTGEILLEGHGRAGIPSLGLPDETGIGWYAVEWPVAVGGITSVAPTPWDLNAWHSSISGIKIRRASTPIEKRVEWGYRLGETTGELNRPRVLLNFLGVQGSQGQTAPALPRVLGEDSVTNDCITFNCWFEKVGQRASFRIDVTACECHAGADPDWLLGAIQESLTELSEMVSQFDREFAL